MRRPFFLVLALLSLLAWRIPAPARAADNSGVDERIDQTREDLQKTKKREQYMRSVLYQNQTTLNKIQSNLSSINNQLQTAQMKVADVRRELSRVEADLMELEEKQEQRRGILGGRINLLYRYGPLSYLELLFSARSFGDMISRYELSSFYLRQDLRLLEDYRDTGRQVEIKRKELEKRHQELKERSQAISVLQARMSNEREKQVDKVRSTQGEVSKIQADRIRLEQALEELERLSRELGEEMRRKGSGAVLGTGKMMWPVVGNITSNFGWRRHPVLRKNKFHSGVDIAVPTGTPVLAADSGVVRIAGWNGGYGYLVAIDHGRGLSTFYGHNSTLLVKAGDVVVKAQRIALAGSTGLSTGPHVHFEVRINGEPVNPIPYLNNSK